MKPTTVVNKHKHQWDVCIQRGSYRSPGKWGNPIGLRSRDALDEALCLLGHAEGLLGSPLLEQLAELKGKRLGCTCAPARCHGDALARLADSTDPRAELVKIVAELRTELVKIVAELRTEVEEIQRERRRQVDMFGGAL